MKHHITEDCSYTLYGGVAVSYCYEPHPQSMPIPHFHKDYELFLLAQGNRKFFCSNKICSLSKATGMFINPFDHHQSTANLDNTSERYCLYISPKLMEAILKENKELGTLKTAMQFELTPETFKKVLRYVHEIQKEYRLKESFSKTAIKNYVTAILITALRNIKETANVESDFEKNDMRLQTTIDFILNNYNTKITIEQCAEMAYMSVSHFSRQFHLMTGSNFKEFLNRVRIEKACELLQNKKYRNKTTIAGEVGFSSSSYFTYVFRSHTGLSPTEYQKAMCKSE